MGTDTYDIIEALLFDYCCGKYTAKHVQSALKGMGYHADLRGNSHIIDVFSNDSGICYPIAT